MYVVELNFLIQFSGAPVLSWNYSTATVPSHHFQIIIKTGTGNIVQGFLHVQSIADCFEDSDITTSKVYLISVYKRIKRYKTVLG
jgi:hypothetical protein